MKNIKAGADIHAGDGGYSEGTKEGYEAFVKARSKPTLYLIRGVAGAGKSTLAKQFVKSGMADVYFEADDYFTNSNGEYNFDHTKLNIAHSQCKEQAERCLENGMNVVVSNTSVRNKDVAVYQSIAWNLQINFVSIIVENRNNTQSIHKVPPDKIKNMQDKFQVKL